LDAVNEKSDIFSLGAILYTLITGQPPHLGDTEAEVMRLVREVPPPPVRSISPRVSRDLETICMKCLEKEPKDRFASADAMAAELDHFLKGEALGIQPPTWRERSRRWARKNRKALTAASIAVLAVLASWVLTEGVRRSGQARRHNLQADKAVEEVRRLYDAGRFDQAVRQARSAEPLYGDTPRRGMIRAWHGAALYEAGSSHEANRILTSTLCRTSDEEARARSLLTLARDRYEHDDFEAARGAMERIKSRWPRSQAAREATFWQGYLFVALGREQAARDAWATARDDSRLPGRLREAARECLANLAPLLPCTRIDLAAVSVVPGQVQADPGTAKQQMIVNCGRRIAVLDWDGAAFCERMAWDSTGPEPRAVLAADVDDDGVVEIIVGEGTDRRGDMVVLKVRPGGLEEFYRHPVGSFLPAAGADVGDVDHDGKTELVLCTKHYGRQCFVFKFGPGPGAKVWPFCEDLQPSSSHAEGVAVGDVDGDGGNEIVAVTAGWQTYDLRICKYDARKQEYAVTWQRPFGVLSGPALADLGGDATPEIIFTKGHTDNSVVFGPASRNGYIADGLHVFAFQEDEYVSRHVFLVDKGTKGNPEGRDTVNCPVAGDLDGDGRTDLAATFERTDLPASGPISWVGVYRNLGDFDFSHFTIPLPPGFVWPIAMGDLDGDEDDELIVTLRDEIRVYGLKDAEGKAEGEVAAAETESQLREGPWVLLAAEELLAVKQYGSAAEEFRSALDELQSPAYRRRAWEGLTACLQAENDAEQLVSALAQFADEFPEIPEPRVRQAEMLVDMGLWKQAGAAAKRIDTEHVRDPALAERHRLVQETVSDMCAEPVSIFETGLDGQKPAEALAGSPLVASIEPGKNVLSLQGVDSGAGRFWMPVRWAGESFELTFEMCVDAMDWDMGYGFGLLSWQEDGTYPDGAWWEFSVSGGGSAVGGGGSFFYGSRLFFGPQGQGTKGPERDHPWKKRCWYRIRLQYIRPLAEVRVRVTERDTGNTFYEGRAKLANKTWPERSYGLGTFAPIRGRPLESTAMARIDRVRLVRYGPDRAANTAPKTPDARRLVLVGNGCYCLGQFQQAVTCYEKALASGDEIPAEVPVFLALAMHAAGNVRGAFSKLIEVGDVEVGFLPALDGLPHSIPYAQMQQLVSQMENQPAEDVAERLLLAAACIYLRKLDQAVRILESIPSDHPLAGVAAYRRAVVAMHRERWPDALQLLNDAVRMQPGCAFPYRKRALLNEQNGDYDEAVADYQEYLDRCPGDGRYWYYYGDCLERIGRRRKSAAVLESAAEAFEKAWSRSNSPDIGQSAYARLKRLRE
jgi:tetratricopeptide (TPR) repeat protein